MARPARKVIRDAQPSFSAGVNLTADPSQLEEAELEQAQESRLTAWGGVVRRGGTQRTHVTAVGGGQPVRGGFGWVKGDGSCVQLLLSNGQLYTGTYAVPMTWTGQGGTFTGANQASFASFITGSTETVYIADGGLLNKWDGTTLTMRISGSPSVARVFVYNQRLFGVGDSANPDTLYFSALNDGDTLGNSGSGGGAIIVRAMGKSTLQNGLAVGASLAIFHKAAVDRFSGYSQDDIAIDTSTKGISNDVGLISPGALCQVENTIYFASDRGIFELNQAGVRPISQKIEGNFQAFVGIPLARSALAVHHAAKHEVLFYFPSTNLRWQYGGTFCYNYRLQAWTGPWQNGTFGPTNLVGVPSTAPTAMWATIDANGYPIVLLGGGDGFVRQFDRDALWKDDVLSDGTGGTTPTHTFQCHRMYGDNPTAEKAYRWVYVSTSNGMGAVTGNMVQTTNTGAVTVSLPSAVGTLANTSSAVQASGRGPFIDVQINDTDPVGRIYDRVVIEGGLYGERR